MIGRPPPHGHLCSRQSQARFIGKSSVERTIQTLNLFLFLKEKVRFAFKEVLALILAISGSELEL